jgi:hypothetical protein
MKIYPAFAANPTHPDPDPKQKQIKHSDFSKILTAQQQTTAHAHNEDQKSTSQTNPKQSTRSDASIEFHQYMSKNDAEKLRLAVLKEMGLTEEEFEQLPPEAQFAIEQKILERLKEQNGVHNSGINTQNILPTV